MIIKLVRHGESLVNTGEIVASEFPDSEVPLSKQGIKQAREAGSKIGSDFILKSLLYTSPYRRTKQTLACIIDGANACASTGGEQLRIYEDVRLREVCSGFEKSKEALDHERETLRPKYGWFYYRHAGGESPADCYDRMSAFIETLMRQTGRKKMSRVLIVSHGMALRCFIMRWLHMTVEDFNSLHNLDNCDIVTITHKDYIISPQFTSGKWGVSGLKLRDAEDLAFVAGKT